ncbi:MAG: hypothetical protein ACLFUJ_02905 [Phycisphaerae bacterium]
MTKQVFLGVLISVAALAGCSKKVTLTFVNDSQTPMDVGLVDAGVDFGYEPLGTAPVGGYIRRELKMEKDALPTTWSWKAEGQDGKSSSGQFIVDENSKDAYTVLLDSGRAYWSDEPQDIDYKKTRVENMDRVPVGEPEMVVE